MSRIATKVYAPGSKKILVSLRGNVHPDVAIDAGREELEDLIKAAQAALEAPAAEWRVVVTATDDASNLVTVGDRLAFLPDDEVGSSSDQAEVL
jgi:hypothetical protein